VWEAEFCAIEIFPVQTGTELSTHSTEQRTMLNVSEIYFLLANGNDNTFPTAPPVSHASSLKIILLADLGLKGKHQGVLQIPEKNIEIPDQITYLQSQVANLQLNLEKLSSVCVALSLCIKFLQRKRQRGACIYQVDVHGLDKQCTILHLILAD